MEDCSMLFHPQSSIKDLYLDPSSVSTSRASNISAGTLSSDEASGKMNGSGSVTKTTKKKVNRQRYAFQTKSYVDILDDGYRWRKYGQKAVKNSKFPRSYYRCTHQGCSVKKQVQRLCKDEEIVVTTYEGIHTHHIDKPNDNFQDILTRQMHIFSNALF